MNLDLGSITEEHKLTDENFRGLFNLMYLRLEGTRQLIGDFGSIRETLLWLSWRNCNQRLNPDIFKTSNLVVLHLQGGWRGAKKLIMPNLRVLAVCGSHVTMTPDVSCCLKLEIMVLKDCFKLKEIHHSVGKLESLTYMNISWCWSLRSLPKELCCPRALRELIVTDCKIEEVPESIGRLESLRTLNLRHNKIRKLPTSISDLTNLLVLDVAHNPLDEGILEEIGRLSALEELDLLGSKIRFLPATVTQLTSLKSLRLDGCEMLEELRGLPTSLTVLDTWDCPLEKGIPEEIGRLSALEDLDLSRSKICSLPGTVSQLTSLKSLCLVCCETLQELRVLPTGLTHFVFSWKSVGLSEEIRCTKEYGKRIITFAGVLDFGFLSRLKTLGWSFPDMASLLTYLKIRDFTLTEMELGGLDSLSSLIMLSIKESHSLLRVSNIGRLRGLRSLKFKRCRALVEIPGLEQLEMLEELSFHRCPSICEIQD